VGERNWDYTATLVDKLRGRMRGLLELGLRIQRLRSTEQGRGEKAQRRKEKIAGRSRYDAKRGKENKITARKKEGGIRASSRGRVKRKIHEKAEGK